MIDFLAQGVHYILSFVFILSIIVFIHEFGHYIIAKWCGVKVVTFSIGFGPEVYGWNDKSGTRWKVSILPFGGFVKMFGDEGAASTPDESALDKMSEEERAVSFHFKPLWQKALIVFAGPAANFILTIAIMTYFLYAIGVASTEPIVGEVIADTPAAAAGLQADDRVVTVNGNEVETFNDISNLIATNIGEPVDLAILRGEETIELSITPKMHQDVDALGNPIERPVIGIRSKQLTIQNFTFFGAIGEATARTYQLCEMSLEFMGQMITGQRSAKDLKGPIGIAQMSGQVTQTGDTIGETTRMILWFIAMLSANLGLINLLPIPMLDGGHLMYYAIEGASGRPLAHKFQEYGFRLGFLLIVSLMAFTLYNDIRQIFL
ncbi:MAG: RIP metalloprotease RseP [Rickettsiales bacterium]|nr:RIP metalloprotease RseP [Rickettsiales bacterium]